jgi:hypothetical protein
MLRQRARSPRAGPRASRDVEPALYAREDLAVTAWQREMLGALRDEKAIAITFVDGPHLDKWHITVTDSKRTHRVAEDRYSVTAKVGIVRAALEAPAPDAAPRPRKSRAAKAA